jgi:hypothetical protein
MECAFANADRHGLLVVPLECSSSSNGGMSVWYADAGMNLKDRFAELQCESPEKVLEEVVKVATDLLLGLEDIHAKVSTLPVGGMCLFTLAWSGVPWW